MLCSIDTSTKASAPAVLSLYKEIENRRVHMQDKVTSLTALHRLYVLSQTSYSMRSFKSMSCKPRISCGNIISSIIALYSEAVQVNGGWFQLIEG